MLRTRPTRRPRPSEEGYILLWVIFLLAIFTLALSVAVPRVAKEIQLDRERETMQRGKQYQRAIQLYYRKFHAYPPNSDALVKTNEIRFLRKKYIDPTTGKDDWKPIRFGQAKTQTLGFFGQPIAGAGSAGGSVLAGIGPSGGNGLNGASSIGGPGSSIGSGSLFAPSNPSTSPAAPAVAPGAFGASAAPGAPGSGSTSTSDTGLSGQTFGGAGIIGFEPASSNPSILIYKKKAHYNEWEFVYDPLTDMRTVSGNTGGIGQPASSTTTPIGGSGFGGNGIGSGTGIGPGSGTGSSPPSTPPATPQQ
jgi:type II secretory pathway pseudopilin PulG